MTDLAVGDKVKIVVEGEVNDFFDIGFRIKGLPNTTFFPKDNITGDFTYSVEKLEKSIEVGDIVKCIDSDKEYLVGLSGKLNINNGVFIAYGCSFELYWSALRSQVKNLGPIK